MILLSPITPSPQAAHKLITISEPLELKHFRSLVSIIMEEKKRRQVGVMEEALDFSPKHPGLRTGSVATS